MSEYKMRVSAKGLFFTKDNRVLLIKGKALYKGMPFWCAPGGGVEKGESLFAAVERELTEETGYFGNAEKVIFVQDFEHSDQMRNLEIFFAGTIDESKEPLAEHDHEEFRFFAKEEMSNITYLPEGADPFELDLENGATYKTYIK